MALFTAYGIVLTYQWKMSFVVIKAFFFYFQPVIGSVTANTFKFHLRTMGRFSRRSKYARPRQYRENEYDKSVSHFLLLLFTVTSVTSDISDN